MGSDYQVASTLWVHPSGLSGLNRHTESSCIVHDFLLELILRYLNPEQRERLRGLPHGSVLYISATIAQNHSLHQTFRRSLDRQPDIDLGRIVRGSGSWIRTFFAPSVIDGTQGCKSLKGELHRYRGIVIGGSVHRYSGVLTFWQKELIDLVAYAILDRQMPFLGLCGGGQIGLLALGGKVAPNLEGMARQGSPAGTLVVRTTEVVLTDAGKRDPIFKNCPDRLLMHEAHQDYFAKIPKEATVLAWAKGVPNLVVGWADRVRLFLSHPEMSVDFMKKLATTVCDSTEDGEARSRLLESIDSLRPTPEANRQVVANFLVEVCS